MSPTPVRRNDRAVLFQQIRLDSIMTYVEESPEKNEILRDMFCNSFDNECKFIYLVCQYACINNASPYPLILYDMKIL